MADRFTLVADLPDASRANGEALRLVGDFLRAKSAKDVDATMRFFSRDTLTYADGTLGVVFEDVALATTRRGVVATIEHLTAAAPPPFGRGAELRRVVGGTRGGGYEWRAANGRPGITGLLVDGAGKVLRMVAAYDHRAFPGHVGG